MARTVEFGGGKVIATAWARPTDHRAAGAANGDHNP